MFSTQLWTWFVLTFIYIMIISLLLTIIDKKQFNIFILEYSFTLSLSTHLGQMHLIKNVKFKKNSIYLAE